MTVEEEKLLRHMISHKAYVILDDFGDMYPIYADGNKRIRPKRWIEKSMLKRMLRLEWLVREGEGVRVADTLQMRLLHPNADTAHSTQAHGTQHRNMREETVYVPSGVQRSVNRNTKVTALKRLARRRDTDGYLLLSSAEVEAGSQFARDYDLSGMGQMSSQNYDDVRVDGSSKHDGAERSIIHSLDRRARVSEAISCLGPGLDRAVIAVCCENWSLDELERAEDWARKSGLIVLKLALGRLAQFYGTHPGQNAKRKPAQDRQKAWKTVKPVRSAS